MHNASSYKQNRHVLALLGIFIKDAQLLITLFYKIISKILVFFSVYFSNLDRIAQSVQRLSYGLDRPGSNPGGDEIFRPSRPAMGPTQPPVKWVPSLSRG